MCGIVFLAGPQARDRIARCVMRLRHRGPDDQSVWVDGDLAMGFARLEINGAGTLGRQPYERGALVGAINGEIYNHRELTAAYDLVPSSCDTHVVLPLTEQLGPRVIDELDGFYAAVVLRTSSREMLCLRDHMGKKPLFVGRSGNEIFIASEIKVFDEVQWFELLPRGASSVDLKTGQVQQIADHRAVEPRGSLSKIFEDAVRKRLPSPEQPVGLFLSGGLDSSLIAASVAMYRDDATYFTLGATDSPDQRAVKAVVDALGLKDVRAVSLPAPEIIPDLIRRVVFTTESFNPSIVSNGLATYLLAEAAHEAGIKVVLTGEGADEFFGGYHTFARDEPWSRMRSHLINDMHFTELRRLDLCCMAHSVEARCPFLDREVRRYSDGLDFDEFYGDEENKVSLRRCFEGVLPPEVIHRKKLSFDVGSGIRREVVDYLRRNARRERDELRAVWRECFSFDESNPYFHAYPAFDAAIDARGAVPR